MTSGGGALRWQVGKHLHLDGLISSQGKSGSGHSGGGSGGSVLVETTNITGHGEINVNGGGSSNHGGAGAGGRIGVHVDFQNNFGGMLLIDLFRLYILFSQYKSCDNTQEDWSFVLLIKKSACEHEYVCMHSF